MPMFRVELHRRIWRPEDYQRNPFNKRVSDSESTYPVSIRSWDFEAKDEAEVRALLDEAYARKLPNVIGYELRSITPISEQNIACASEKKP